MTTYVDFILVVLEWKDRCWLVKGKRTIVRLEDEK